MFSLAIFPTLLSHRLVLRGNRPSSHCEPTLVVSNHFITGDCIFIYTVKTSHNFEDHYQIASYYFQMK